MTITIDIVAVAAPRFRVSKASVFVETAEPDVTGMVPSVVSLTWDTQPSDNTPSFTAVYMNATMHVMDFQYADDAAFSVNSVVLSQTVSSSGSYVFTTPVLSDLAQRYARARINAGAWVNLASGTFAINTGGGTPTLTAPEVTWVTPPTLNIPGFDVRMPLIWVPAVGDTITRRRAIAGTSFASPATAVVTLTQPMVDDYVANGEFTTPLDFGAVAWPDAIYDVGFTYTSGTALSFEGVAANVLIDTSTAETISILSGATTLAVQLRLTAHAGAPFTAAEPLEVVASLTSDFAVFQTLNVNATAGTTYDTVFTRPTGTNYFKFRRVNQAFSNVASISLVDDVTLQGGAGVMSYVDFGLTHDQVNRNIGTPGGTRHVLVMIASHSQNPSAYGVKNSSAGTYTDRLVNMVNIGNQGGVYWSYDLIPVGVLTEATFDFQITYPGNASSSVLCLPLFAPAVSFDGFSFGTRQTPPIAALAVTESNAVALTAGGVAVGSFYTFTNTGTGLVPTWPNDDLFGGGHSGSFGNMFSWATTKNATPHAMDATHTRPGGSGDWTRDSGVAVIKFKGSA
jgi:hypothetical protein